MCNLFDQVHDFLGGVRPGQFSRASAEFHKAGRVIDQRENLTGEAGSA